ncbi:MAG: c-type cytochrome [Acidobacteriia bacterium]|nr:c-type cytochrome [Terriglobia bacterium]
MMDPSKKYRWLLLFASLLTIGLLIAAAVRENFLAEWQTIQKSYRNLLREKATDKRGRELLAAFRIELRQVSLPQFGTVDRCVTCHLGIDDPRMAGARRPFAAHSGAILDRHPADRFGCTVCHHGQGAATGFNEAKAEDVYWDYPLLPPDLTESTCVTCHDPARLPELQVSRLILGMKLYQQKSCGSCHKLGGRGGMLGPALDNEGAKTRHQLVMTGLKPPHTTWRWHQAHFNDPGAVIAGSQMKNPTVTDGEALALTVYMLSLRQRDVPESYLAPDKIEQKSRALHPPLLAGEQVYRQYCFACHGEGTYGRWDKTFKRFVPAIRGVSLLATATPLYLETNIAKGRQGTQMPAWEAQAGGLQPEEIAAVQGYLRSGLPGLPLVPPAPAVVRGDKARGAMLFVNNCMGCHGPGGRGGLAPEIGNPTFNFAASDEFIVATIRNGRKGAAMPSFQRPGATGLDDGDIGDLLAYIRSLNATPAPAGADKTLVQPRPTGGKQ